MQGRPRLLEERPQCGMSRFTHGVGHAEAGKRGARVLHEGVARINALGHAVALLTVRCGAPGVDDVLALAERLERWVLR